MIVRCPHCSVNLKLADHLAGRKMRCPRCSNVVPLIPVEEPASTETPDVTPRADQQYSTSRDEGENLFRVKGDDMPLVIPVRDDGAGYDLDAVETTAAAVSSALEPSELPALARAGTIVTPTKAKSAKARELMDLKAEGNTYLRTIRWLLLILGGLMIAWNVYAYISIDGDVAAFRQAVTSDTKIRVDMVKLEAFLKSFRVAMRVETILYLLLGITFCVLGVFIHMAPMVITWAALGSYVGIWIIHLIAIEAVFGSTAVGMSLYSLGTVIKAVIISGLWYGVRVGTAYEEQVHRPIRDLLRQALDGSE